MKRKGFTLVELLAVIVILAVISIITIPMIGSVIEDSKKKALEQSVYGLVEAADYFTISNDGIYEFLFDETKKGETAKGDSLDYNGEVDAEGKLYIDNYGNVSLCLENEDYYVYKNYNSGIYIGEMTGNGCTVGYDALTNKYVAMLDDGTGTITNVYTKEEVNEIVDELDLKVTSNINEINSVKDSITNIQTDLSNYALKTDLERTNGAVQDLSSVVNNNSNKLETINNQLIKYKVMTIATGITLEAGKFSSVDYNVTELTGIPYNKTIAVIPSANYTTGTQQVILTPRIGGSGWYIRPVNTSSVSVTVNINVTVLYYE